MQDIKKIAVIMFGLFGDVLIRTPILKALKEIYPDAKITAIVDPVGVYLLEDNVYVDDLIIINRSINKLQKKIKEMQATFEIRKQQFDLIVNLYNGGSSPWMVLFSNAKYKLGFCQQKRKYIYNVNNDCLKDRLKDEQSLYSYMISIIEPLSSKKHSLRPVFFTTKVNDLKMKEYLKEFNVDVENVYLLNLGASKEEKLLDMNKYLELVKYIYKTYNFIPAIILNPTQEYLQEKFIEDFLKLSKLPYIKLDSLSISEIASLIKLTKFIITPDTGIMHLSMAMNTYIYAIFTYTHPIFVDPNDDKFISVYDKFNDGKLYQQQNISSTILEKNIKLLFSKL
ncbi:glycosyltransferase family 9 protein [Sulfurimonas autotrophica]|uniref:Glycosyl transferase family 9 n=1 Tax=Sulfurimonas autotrophica (strain ATCC BAA-671 / DSM 16294 / JCM 11897 / OK10) TaxID=563040 RepID=E0UV22_SULAO|nr:glycosyltransferase family 9 protein [Sulfurimonas autotrophica]ADN09604.1 glycosyl transferase family 9 [Sulfurimonas autotrophica DSM 16294]